MSGEVRVVGEGERDSSNDVTGASLARWGVAGLISAAALVGMVALLFVIFVATQPPAWVQVVLGVALAAGAAVLTWLIASALTRKDARSSSRR